MKILLKIAYLAALCGCLDLAVAQNSQPQQVPVTLTLSSPQSTMHAGSEVKLDITLTNVSQKDFDEYLISTNRPRDIEGGYKVDVRDSENKPVKETDHGMKVHGTDPNEKPFSGSVFSGHMVIKPGGTAHRTRILSQEFDLSKPGHYTVQAERRDRLTNILVKSNKLEITLLP
jgi:hypothetical protein